MAYRLDKFNGTVLTVLEDGSLDTSTDLRFIGKNYAGYGEVQNENFLHLLENFANNSAPPRPITGQIWFDSTDIFKKIKVYDGNQWKTVGSAQASTTSPIGLTAGDFWFDTTADQLYIWNGSQYILIGPESLPILNETNVDSVVVKDVLNINHRILKCNIDNKTIAIVSKDEFLLNGTVNPITGFNRVKKGFTLVDTNDNTGITSTDHYYWGTTSNALRFNGRPVSDFVLKEETNKFFDEGFTVGDSDDLRIWIENGDSPVIEARDPVTSLSTITLRVVTSLGNQDIAVVNFNSISPGITNSYNLGSLNSRWSKIYSTDFFGNLTGNTQGIHKGNVTDNSNTVRFNAANGNFSGDLTGNVTGNLTGNTQGNHRGNLLSSDGLIRFNAANGTFIGNITGDIVGNLEGNTQGTHRGNLLSSDGSIRFNASNSQFNGQFIGLFTGEFTGFLNGLATNVTGVVESINGGTGNFQYDDGDILIGNGTILTKGRLTGISPIQVTRTSTGFNIGYIGSLGSVTSVELTAGNGIGIQGGPITSSGSFTVTNTGVTQIVAGSNVTISPTTGRGAVTISAIIPPPTLTGVSRIIAGSNITISPSNGLGEVTINSTAIGGGALPIASSTTLGGIRVGSGLSINPSTGVLDVTVSGGGGGGDMFLAATQTVTGAKTFTGGIISQAYNFTSTGNSIFYTASPINSVQIAVDNSFPHNFYKTRLVIDGSADGIPGEKFPGGAIVGLDGGITGGAGVVGVHTNNRPGIGVGVAAGATNLGFTGAVFQGTTIRAKSSSFVGLRLYTASNADPIFVVQGNGDVSFDGTATSPAADYAEYFEWADGNLDNEDRTGMTVSLSGEKIKIAQPGEIVIGVVSAVPAMVGDARELEWQGKFLRDDFGRYIYEDYSYYTWTDSEGKSQSEPSYGDLTKVPDNAVRKDTDELGNKLRRPKYNPDYDPSTKYVPRSQRPEWSAIGLVGKLRILKGQQKSSNWIKLRDINSEIEEWLVK